MTRGSGRRSDRPARVPTWTLAVIAVLVIGGVLVLGYLAGRDATSGSTSAAFGRLAVGDCLDVRVEGVPPDRVASDDAVRDAVILGDARRTPCDTPHSHEVAEISGYDIGDAYRGDDFLIAIARPACEAGFARYVGHPLEGSTVGMVIVAPDTSRWQAGERRAICLVRRNDGAYAARPLRGSAQ